MKLSAISRHGPAMVMGLIVAVAVVLRLRQAGHSMVYDEMASMYFSGRPFSDLWGWWLVRETNPPLFYSLLRLWRMIVPGGACAMRALPLAIAFVHLALFGWFMRARFGRPAAALALLLFALSPADIYQAAYVRGYVLAKLAVLVSFIGLVFVLDGGPRAWRGWLAYIAGAVIAIYCHTTMVLWPVIATLAVLADAALRRDQPVMRIARLIGANLIIMAASSWVIIVAIAQLHSRAANISWLKPLSLEDYESSLNLQLLTDGTVSMQLMVLLFLIGAWRTFGRRETRLSVIITLIALVVFKAADTVHPITSDFTLHWCFNFTALVAGAALSGATPGEDPVWRVLRRGSALAMLAAVLVAGLVDLLFLDWVAVPQDWRYTVETVAHTPGAALMASHESMGVVIEQACGIEFGSTRCPFPLVVLDDPLQTDSWAFGGYQGHMVPLDKARQALGKARTVYVFSRYFYAPLEHLGLDPGDWPQKRWDDGELIGPVPVDAFDPPEPGSPPRVPNFKAEYTGQDDDNS